MRAEGELVFGVKEDGLSVCFGVEGGLRLRCIWHLQGLFPGSFILASHELEVDLV